MYRVMNWDDRPVVWPIGKRAMFFFAISGILLVVVFGVLSWVSIQRQAAIELFLDTLYNNEPMDEERAQAKLEALHDCTTPELMVQLEAQQGAIPALDLIGQPNLYTTYSRLDQKGVVLRVRLWDQQNDQVRTGFQGPVEIETAYWDGRWVVSAFTAPDWDEQLTQS